MGRLSCWLILLWSLEAGALPAVLEAPSAFDQKPLRLALADGIPKVVLFVSARCPCSSSHEKLIAALAREFKEYPFVAVHSNANENEAKDRAHFSNENFTIPVMRDDGAKIADEFRALKTPHAFIVDGKGKIIYSGGVTNSAHAPTASRQYLRDALATLRGGKSPEPAEVRALGCVITRP